MVATSQSRCRNDRGKDGTYGVIGSSLIVLMTKQEK